MRKNGYIYFMSNKKDGVIYIGVTSNLIKRVYEHRVEAVEGFTKKYNLKKLVYFEVFDDIETAIIYEKKLKNIGRAKKIAIIERTNKEWKDLYEEIAS